MGLLRKAYYRDHIEKGAQCTGAVMKCARHCVHIEKGAQGTGAVKKCARHCLFQYRDFALIAQIAIGLS